MGYRWGVGSFVVATLLLPPAALAQADQEAGRALAQRWCSGCHITARGAAGAVSDAAPPFTAIAGNPDRTAEWLLRRVAVDPHPVMPNLDLTLQQARDLNAYLDSLARRQGEEGATPPGGGG